MRKLDFANLIAQSVVELREREKKEKDARVRVRIQLLRLLKTQATATIKDACGVCGITPKHDLWKKYQAQGFEQYGRLNWKPRRAKLSADEQAELLERAASENGFGSQSEARRYVQEKFGVSYTQSGVCLLFQRLRIKAKEPRPLNIKASGEEQSAYKKTLRGE